jgi:cytochrome c biogenesis protein CcmG, thiol:disulfide interchange protein DsbE
MRRLAALVVAMAVVAACSGGSDDEGVVLPDLTLGRFDTVSETVELSSLRGSPAVINFFGSYCAPCVREMPALERAHQQLGDRVRFVGINTSDFDEQAAASLIEDTGITFEVLVDPQGDLLAAVESSVMPTTLFVNADGAIVERHVGELTEDEIVDTITDRLLSEEAAS